MKTSTRYFAFWGALARTSARYVGTVPRLALFTCLLVALIFWSGSMRCALAQVAPDQPSLSFLSDPLALQIKEDEGEIHTQVIVRNGSPRSTDLKFSAVLRDSNGKWLKGVNIISPSDIKVSRYSVTPIDLAIPKIQFGGLTMPLKGFLVVSGTPEITNNEEAGVAPGTLPLTVSKPRVLPPRLLGMSPLNLAILVPFVISFLVVILCSYRVVGNSVENLSRGDMRREPTRRKLNLLSTLGSGLTLDFSKSWASLLTVATAIVTAVTSAQVFPVDRPYFTQQQTAGLALFFGGMVVFGPTIYNLFRFRKKTVTESTEPDAFYRVERRRASLVCVVSESLADAKPNTGTEPQLQGFILTFLLSSALTLGALLGQLAVAGFLIYQIDTAMSLVGRALLIGAIVVIELLALIYIGYTVHLAVEDKGTRRASLKRERPDLFKTYYTYEEPQTMP